MQTCLFDCSLSCSPHLSLVRHVARLVDCSLSAQRSCTFYLDLTAAARSVKASLRLKRASSITPANAASVSFTCGQRRQSIDRTRTRSATYSKGKLTGIGIAAEMSRPLHERGSLLSSAGDGITADGADHRAVSEGGRRCNYAVGNEVVDALFGQRQSHSRASRRLKVRGRRESGLERRGRTECSSCFTSSTVPSLKLHLTISVSGLVPLTSSALSSLLQKLAKEGSLIRCHT